MQDAELTQARLLVVEDNDEARITAVETINNDFPEYWPKPVIHEAWDGETMFEALAHARKHNLPYDIVVLDLEMGIKKGDGLVQDFGLQVLNNKQFRERLVGNAAVIVFTQHSYVEYAFRAGSAGAIIFISKHNEAGDCSGFGKLASAVIGLINEKMQIKTLEEI